MASAQQRPPEVVAAAAQENVLLAERLKREARKQPPLLAPNEKAVSLLAPLELGQLPASEQARAATFRANPRVLSVMPVRIDGSAMNSTVISVFIDGVQVFRGKRHDPDKFGTWGWSGHADDGMELSLGVSDGLVGGKVGSISGELFITGKPPYGLLTRWARDDKPGGHGISPLPSPASASGVVRVEPVVPR